MTLHRIVMSSVLLALMSLSTACVITHREGYNEGYREGYYDREHHRWWHEHAWRECIEHDEHCHD